MSYEYLGQQKQTARDKQSCIKSPCGIHFLKSKLHIPLSQKNEETDRLIIDHLDSIFALPMKFGASPYCSVGVSKAYERDLDKIFG